MRISDWSSDVCSSDLRTRLAVDVYDHGFDVVARVQHGACIFDTAGRDFRCAQVAFDVDRQSHDSTLGFDRFDDARNHGALIVGGHEVVEGVAFQLFDTQRDAFLVGVDAQNHCVDFVALLEVAHGFFAGFRPGKVGQVNQAVDAAGQAHNYAEEIGRAHV